MRRAIAPVAAAAMLLAACSGSDSTGPEQGGSYSAAVSGDLTATISGPAYFGSETSNGETVFAVVLGSNTSPHLVVLASSAATRPGVGTYDVVGLVSGEGETGWSALHMVGQGNQLVGSFLGVSGTVTITESTAQRVRGTFEYAAEGFIGGSTENTEASISVTGEFNASPATAGSLSASFQRVSGR
jgi:hypothetical protein